MTRPPLLLAPVLALSMAACAGSTYVVTEAPPPPQQEKVTVSPGHVWVDGHWMRARNRWAWSNGYYVREHQNAHYVAGRWEQRPNGQGYVWVGGGFRAGGTVVTR